MNTPRSFFRTQRIPGRHHSWRPLLATLLFSPALLSAQVAVQAQTADDPAKQAEATTVDPKGPAPKTAAAKPAPTKTDPTKPVPTESVYELSPFEVNASKDEGFMATNAGTATKLGLDLEEMSAAYSVMTREFIDALGITNLEDSSVWAVGGAKAATDGTPNDSLSTPNTVFTTQRGQMNQTGQQRNFFLNAGIGDTYNFERIDFGRGPNAVLFNFGDINNPFAGGVSAQTKQAFIGNTVQNVSLRGGSWGYLRSMVDVNRALSPRLAVRTNLLVQENNGYRIGQMDDREGAALAVVFRPDTKSQINVSANYDRVARTQPHAAIFDNLSGWDGVTVFNGPITNAILGAGRNSTTRAPLAGAVMSNGQFLTSSGDVQGVTRMSTTARNVYIPGQGIMNWQNYATTVRGDINEYVPVYMNGQTFSRYNLWQTNVASGIYNSARIAPTNLLQLGSGISGGNIPLLYQEDLPGDRFARAIAGSSFVLPDKRFSLMPRDTPLMIERNRGINLAANRTLTNDLFFSLTADVNDTDRRIINQGAINRMRYAYVDINRLLPDGSVNPHFLETYSDDTNIASRRYRISNAGIRASLAYILDAEKWGLYTFNVGVAATERTTTDRQWILSLARDADPRKWAGDASVVKVRVYWDDPIMPLDLTTPLPYFSNTFDSANNVVGNTRADVTPIYVNNGGSEFHESNRGVTFAVAGRYFRSEKLGKPRLIATVGGQLNRSATERKDMMIRGDLPSTWDSVSMVWKPDAPEDWSTLTYLTKDANGVVTSPTVRPALTRPRGTSVEGVAPRLAQYASDRFRDDYNLPARISNVRNLTAGFVYNLTPSISAKVNYSNSFTPPAVGALDLNTDPALPVSAFGYDARLSFAPRGRRMVVNVGWFYNESAHNRVASPAQGAINGLLGARNYYDLNTSNRNEFGYYDLTGSDYEDRNNLGYELEVVGRLAKGLEMTASFARFHGRSFNRYNLTPDFITSRADEFLEVLKSAGGMLDTTRKASLSAPGFAVIDPAKSGAGTAQDNMRNTAINNYNSIWVQYDNVLSRVADGVYSQFGLEWNYTWNLFFRYTFPEGRLKGFKVGLGANSTGGRAWSNQAGNLVPNSSYNKDLAFNTNLGVLGEDGRYTYKDAAGVATGYNAPWMPDPAIDQRNPPLNRFRDQLNTVLTLGYTQKISQKRSWLPVREINYNLVINNVLNLQKVHNDPTSSLRAPNGDFLANQTTRVATIAGLTGYQEPINGSFEVTFKF